MISILYVDDEPDLLELAQIFLEQTGEFRVRISTSAEEVLGDSEILSFDAILSDYQMPGMDGIAFLKEIRKRSFDLPFILFTGRGREEIVIEALNNGADFYIQKGGDPKAQFVELANKIRYAVRRKRAERELQKKSDELNASYEQIAANEEELRQQLDELTAKQEALKNSEEKFRAFTENVPDLTTISDINGNYQYISPSIKRLVGQDADGLLGKKYTGISSFFGILPEDTEILLTSGRGAIARPGEPMPVPPFRVRDTKGELIFIEGSITYLPDVKGIQGLLFHGRDITDRVRAEEEIDRKNRELRLSFEQLTASEEELRGQYEELAFGEKRIRENEEKFRTLFEKIHEALIVYSDKKFQDCNQRALELFGYASKEEFLALRPMDIFPPAQPDGQDSVYSAEVHLRKALQEGSAHFEWVHKKRDGSLFSADVLLSLFELDKKQLVLASIRDISDRKRTEDELQLLKISVDQSSDEVFWLDFSGAILYVNDAACRATGYSREELCSMKLYELDPDFVPQIWESSVADLRAKKTQFIQTRHQRKDGTLVDVEIVAVYVSKGDREYSFAFVRDITGRKRTEQILAESEERYRTLVENASEVIAIVQDWKIVFVNRQGARLLGKTPTELTGRPFMDFIWPEDRERMKSIHGTRITGEPAPEMYDFRIIGAGEKPAWVSNSITAISWEGKPATLSLMTNITERKLAEAALLESEETFRSVIEGAPEAIYIGAEWNFQYLNPAALRLFGASSGEQLIGTPFMDRIHPKFHDAIRDRVQGLYGDRMAAPPLEEVYLKLDGSEVEVEVSSVPFRYKGKDGALVFIWDITDRKKAERARRESEAEYRRILDTMQDAYIRVNTEGKIIMVNPSAARMFKYASPREMHGIPVAALYSNPLKREEIVSRLEKDEMVTDVVEMMLRMDSTTFWASINVQAIRGEDGSLIGNEGIIRDVSERTALEQAIQDTNKKLSLLNSITRHDVANQLTALRGYAQLAVLSNPDPVVLDFLQKIETATDTIAGQIEFTKTYQELGEETPAWFRIDTIIEKTARTEVSFSNTCRAIEVFSDPMIERVFYNLFDNAIRHGEHVTTIGVRCERAPDGLVIYVEDDGVGVVPEEKEKIFEKGYGKNTGFGLFLAREILATTSITIRETGYVGVGARFEITVPKEMWRIFPGG